MVYNNIFSIQQEIMDSTVYSIEYKILLLEKLDIHFYKINTVLKNEIKESVYISTYQPFIYKDNY